MLKIILLGQRFYLKDLNRSQINCIHNNLNMYNLLFHYVYHNNYGKPFYEDNYICQF